MALTMFPHVVTVYVNTEDLVSFDSSSNITVLRGVLCDAAHAANVKASGLENADAVTVYIPFEVEAVDGLTGAPKSYVSPKDFYAAEDKTGLWTLDPAPPTGVSVFVAKGEVVDPGKDYQWINRTHDDVWRITSVDTKDFGLADMQHWEVGGR